MSNPKLNVYVLTMEYYDDDLERDRESRIGIFFSRDNAETDFSRMLGLSYPDKIEFTKQGKGWWMAEDPAPGIHEASISKCRVDRRIVGIEWRALKVVIAKVRKEATKSASGTATGTWLGLPSFADYITDKKETVEDS